MWDQPTGRSRWRIGRSPASLALVVLLVASLGTSGYLLARADVRDLVFSAGSKASGVSGATQAPSLALGAAASQAQPAAANATRSNASSPAASGQGLSVLLAAGPTGSENAAPKLDDMIAQLAQMQQELVTAANQLGAAPAVLPAFAIVDRSGEPVVRFSEAAQSGERATGLMAEIQQLYQVMQPLMVQMQVAANSYRSPSELMAMRNQMGAIHARLSELMAQVEATRQTSNSALQPSSTGAAGSEAATLEQLQRRLTELEGMLQQIQNSP